MSSRLWLLALVLLTLPADAQGTRVDYTGSITPLEGLEGDDEHGHSVAISDRWAVVGVPGDDHGGARDAGSAIVYARTGSDWTFVERLRLPRSEIRDRARFGTAVDIEGDRIVVASRTVTDVYVYQRAGHGGWVRTAIVEFPLPESYSGTFISLQGDRLLASKGEFSLLGPGAYEATYANGHWVISDSLSTTRVGSTGTASQAAFTDSLAAFAVASSGQEEGRVIVFERTSSGWRETEPFDVSNVRLIESLAVRRNRISLSARWNGFVPDSIVVAERTQGTWAETERFAVRVGDRVLSGVPSIALTDSSVVAVAGLSSEVGVAEIRVGSGGANAEWRGGTFIDDGNPLVRNSRLALSDSLMVVGYPNAYTGLLRTREGVAVAFTLGDNDQWLPSKLMPPGVERSEQFVGLGLAADGRQLLVRGADGARVHTRSDDEWTDGTLIGGGSTDETSMSLAIAIEGPLAIIGTPDGLGSVRSYYYGDKEWQQVDGLSGGGGRSPWIALDGNRALIGSARQGGACSFTFDGTRWRPDGMCFRRDEVDFGSAVALSGSRAVVASRDPRDGGLGRVSVFEDTGDRWALVTTIEGTTSGLFGFSVATDGSRVVASAPGFSGATSAPEPVTVFSGLVPVSTATLVTPGTRSTAGSAIALDGDRLVVGVPLDDSDGDDAGAAYLFEFDGTAWSVPQRLRPSSPLREGDRFGASVAVSGPRIFVGAPRDDMDGMDSGTVHVFESSFRTPSDPPLDVREIVLSSPAPNPSRRETRLSLSLPTPDRATVTLHDALGRHVATVLDGQTGQETTLEVNTSSLAPGVYFIRARVGATLVTRPLSVVR